MVKPLFFRKIQTPGNLTLLVDDDQLIFQDEKVAEILHDCIVNIAAGLEISELEQNLTKINISYAPLDISIYKYNSYPSVQLIKQNLTGRHKFSFRHVFLEEKLAQLRDLDPSKSSTLGCMSVKILTKHSEFLPQCYISISKKGQKQADLHMN